MNSLRSNLQEITRRLEQTFLGRCIFGVTLALVGWLLIVALIMVTATVIAAEFDRSEGAVARWVRARLSPTEGDAG